MSSNENTCTLGSVAPLVGSCTAGTQGGPDQNIILLLHRFRIHSKWSSYLRTLPYVHWWFHLCKTNRTLKLVPSEGNDDTDDDDGNGDDDDDSRLFKVET